MTLASPRACNYTYARVIYRRHASHALENYSKCAILSKSTARGTNQLVLGSIPTEIARKNAIIDNIRYNRVPLAEALRDGIAAADETRRKAVNELVSAKAHFEAEKASHLEEHKWPGSTVPRRKRRFMTLGMLSNAT
jgi:hypothetical protein